MIEASVTPVWVILRLLLFGVGLGSYVMEVSPERTIPYLAVLYAAAGVWALVGSFLFRSGSASVERTVAITDVLVVGLLYAVTQGAHGTLGVCLYGLVCLASLGSSTSIGLAAAVVAALLYLLASLLSMSKGGPSVVGAFPSALLLFVFGYLGAMIRTVVRETRTVQMVETRDSKLEEAQRQSRDAVAKRQEFEAALREKERRLKLLMAIAQRLSSIRKPDDLLKELVIKAKAEMNCGVSFVMLLNEEDVLQVNKSLGIELEMTERMMNCRSGEGIFGQVVATGAPIRVSEKDGDPRLQVFKMRGTQFRDALQFRNIMVVPLKSSQDPAPFGVVGVANALVGDGFGEEDEQFLTTLATSAAISLQNIQLYEELERSYYEIIHALAQAIEAKDPYTHGHVGRVREYAIDLANALRLPEKEIELISKGAILHDVGKISTPNEILNKPGALTPQERKIMDAHVTSAIHILKDITSLSKDVFEYILFHHERYDGKGYPYGLKGDDIPLGAQVISVVDAFDAMTSDRPYRKGFPREKALELLRNASGTQFNPVVLQAFFSLFDAKLSKNAAPALQIRK